MLNIDDCWDILFIFFSLYQNYRIVFTYYLIACSNPYKKIEKLCYNLMCHYCDNQAIYFTMSRIWFSTSISKIPKLIVILFMMRF
ncbi:hypothetical protein CR513_38201, partial [Mucuna pruriens]